MIALRLMRSIAVKASVKPVAGPLGTGRTGDEGGIQ